MSFQNTRREGGGLPLWSKQRKRSRSFSIPIELDEWLDAVATARGETKAAIVIEALEDYLPKALNQWNSL